MSKEELAEKEEQEMKLIEQQQKKTEKYQSKNLGGFEKIYPLTYVDDPEDAVMVAKKERALIYEEVKEAAKF